MERVRRPRHHGDRATRRGPGRIDRARSGARSAPSEQTKYALPSLRPRCPRVRRQAARPLGADTTDRAELAIAGRPPQTRRTSSPCACSARHKPPSLRQAPATDGAGTHERCSTALFPAGSLGTPDAGPAGHRPRFRCPTSANQHHGNAGRPPSPSRPSAPSLGVPARPVRALRSGSIDSSAPALVTRSRGPTSRRGSVRRHGTSDPACWAAKCRIGEAARIYQSVSPLSEETAPRSAHSDPYNPNWARAPIFQGQDG